MRFIRPPPGISLSSHPRPCQGPPENKPRNLHSPIKSKPGISPLAVSRSPPCLPLHWPLCFTGRLLRCKVPARHRPLRSLPAGGADGSYLFPYSMAGANRRTSVFAKAASGAWLPLFRAQRARSYRDVPRSRLRRRWSSRCPGSASSPFPERTGRAPVRAAAAPPVAAATLRLRFPPPPHRAPRSAALEHRDWRRGGAGFAHQPPALRRARWAVPAADKALGSLARPRRAFLGEPVPHPLRSLRGRYRPRAPQSAGTRLPAPLPPLSPRRSAQAAHRRRSLVRRLMNMQIQARGRLMAGGQVINILVSARGFAGARPAPAAG